MEIQRVQGGGFTGETARVSGGATQPTPAPQVQQQAPVEAAKGADQQLVENTVKKHFDLPSDVRFQMEFDKDINRLIVRYIDKANGEVVRQIPEEKVVEFQKAFVNTLSILFDKKV